MPPSREPHPVHRPRKECLRISLEGARLAQPASGERGIGGALAAFLDLARPTHPLAYEPGLFCPSLLAQLLAREVQERRQGSPNSALSGRRLREACALKGDAETLFSRAVDRMGLSGRGHDRVLRVARTVADLSGEEDIAAEHVAEALNYRRSHLGGR